MILKSLLRTFLMELSIETFFDKLPVSFFPNTDSLVPNSEVKIGDFFRHVDYKDGHLHYFNVRVTNLIESEFWGSPHVMIHFRYTTVLDISGNSLEITDPDDHCNLDYMKFYR